MPRNKSKAAQSSRGGGRGRRPRSRGSDGSQTTPGPARTPSAPSHFDSSEGRAGKSKGTLQTECQGSDSSTVRRPDEASGTPKEPKCPSSPPEVAQTFPLPNPSSTAGDLNCLDSISEGYTVSLSRSSLAARRASAAPEGLSRRGSPLFEDGLDHFGSGFDLVHQIQIQLSDSREKPVAVLVGAQHIVLGCLGGNLVVVDRRTFEVLRVLKGHRRAIQALAWVHPPDAKQPMVLSTSADGTVRLWNLLSFRCENILVTADGGSILAAAVRGDVLYLGCQDTSIQWVSLKRLRSKKDTKGQTTDAKLLASRESSYFFDERTLHSFCHPDERAAPPTVSLVPCSNVRRFAHQGYVYSLLSLPDGCLASGGGDGFVRIWRTAADGDVELIHTLACTPVTAKDMTGSRNSLDKFEEEDDMADDPGGVVSLVFSKNNMGSVTLFAGVHGGAVHVWDLETTQCVRILMEHQHDVLWSHVTSSLHQKGDDNANGQVLITAGSDGTVKCWCLQWAYACILSQNVHADIVAATSYEGLFVTLHQDGIGRVWKVVDRVIARLVADCDPSTQASHLRVPSNQDTLEEIGISGDTISQWDDHLIFALRNWIPLRTVSGSSEHAIHCRAGAQYLKSIMMQVGAEARLLPGDPGRNPIVFGRFRPSKKESNQAPMHILFYGHYDVVPADPNEWETDPFVLFGKNGYLHGRGVSDDKGPILAAIFGAAELHDRGELDAMVTFVIEGEEENASYGMASCFDTNADLLLLDGHGADVILMSNGSWLGEMVPCVGFGQRGVVHATVRVQGQEGDRHAGVDGGAVTAEPLPDLLHLLSRLTNPAAPAESRVCIPGFYDAVAKVSSDEDAMLNDLAHRLVDFKDGPAGSQQQTTEEAAVSSVKRQLVHKWRTPTLTISQVLTSGGTQSKTVISQHAKATVSIRTVPDQSAQALVDKLKSFLEMEFAELQKFRATGSSNRLRVDVTTAADAWLGSPADPMFQCAMNSVEAVWREISGTRVKPLAVREGGSTLPLHWLRRKAAGTQSSAESRPVPVVNVPLAQSSDRAHLPNERIALRNLLAGRRVMRECIRNMQQLLGRPRRKST